MLSRRQKEALEFIAGFTAENGYPPTLREMGSAMSIKSVNAVSEHLDALVRKGYIARTLALSRGISLTAEALALLNPREEQRGNDWAVELVNEDVVFVPLVGRIAAGTPILAEENIQRRMALSPDFLPRGTRPDKLFALRVVGDSMRNAGIHDGDVIIARSQKTAEQGAIVVALLGDSATVKRFYQDADGLRFEPENPSFKTIRVNSQDAATASIQGLVVAVIHKV